MGYMSFIYISKFNIILLWTEAFDCHKESFSKNPQTEFVNNSLIILKSSEIKLLVSYWSKSRFRNKFSKGTDCC